MPLRSRVCEGKHFSSPANPSRTNTQVTRGISFMRRCAVRSLGAGQPFAAPIFTIHRNAGAKLRGQRRNRPVTRREPGKPIGPVDALQAFEPAPDGPRRDARRRCHAVDSEVLAYHGDELLDLLRHPQSARCLVVHRLGQVIEPRPDIALIGRRATGAGAEAARSSASWAGIRSNRQLYSQPPPRPSRRRDKSRYARQDMRSAMAFMRRLMPGRLGRPFAANSSAVHHSRSGVMRVTGEGIDVNVNL